MCQLQMGKWAQLFSCSMRENGIDQNPKAKVASE